MRPPLVALAVASGLSLASCAGRARPAALEPPPAAPVTPAPQAADLYQVLERGRVEHREGVALLEAGEEVAGEELIGRALGAIREATESCAGLAGCEIARFLDALEWLHAEQSIALKRQTSRIETLETAVEGEEVEREPGTTPFVAEMPEIGRTPALLRGTDLREIIALNGPVSAAIDDWLTWMRPQLLSAWENYEFLREEMAPIYEEAGLPEALLFAMLATESGGKVHAHSRSGAAGPLQFMARTGRLYGLRDVDGFDLRLDPAAATRANVAYLDDRFREFDGSLEKALAAYNGGESRMRGLDRRLGGVPFWDSRMYYALPQETREYVPRILAAAWLFLHPEDYGLELPAVETDKASLVLEQEISLGELAICLGQAGSAQGWFRTLRNLNPRLEPGERLAAGGTVRIPATLAPVYAERCLSGPLREIARNLHDASHPAEPAMATYVVRSGDTLAAIAGRHSCVTIPALAAMNGVRPPGYVIRIGQVLNIPACD
jgi:membrane-bound lytic murein transglycosylase D